MTTAKLDAAMKRISMRSLATLLVYFTLTAFVAGCGTDEDLSDVETESVQQGVQSSKMITIDDYVDCSVGQKDGLSFYDCSKSGCDSKCSGLGFARSKVVSHKYGTSCDTSKQYGRKRQVRCACSLLKAL